MADINPLRYRGYYYDHETGLYHLWSRYYDPQTGRFISPDSYASTGQGVLGYNMFAYCQNNPANYFDPSGNAAVMTCHADADMLFGGGLGYLGFGGGGGVGGFIIAGMVTLVAILKYGISQPVLYTETPVLNVEEANASYTPTPPNNNNSDDDDDDDDDYYDDESNFGGRQKIGRSKGQTPRSNKAQNAQFDDATKGLNKKQKEIIHHEISGEGLGYHGIKELRDTLFIFVICLLF